MITLPSVFGFWSAFHGYLLFETVWHYTDNVPLNKHDTCCMFYFYKWLKFVKTNFHDGFHFPFLYSVCISWNVKYSFSLVWHEDLKIMCPHQGIFFISLRLYTNILERCKSMYSASLYNITAHLSVLWIIHAASDQALMTICKNWTWFCMLLPPCAYSYI